MALGSSSIEIMPCSLTQPGGKILRSVAHETLAQVDSHWGSPGEFITDWLAQGHSLKAVDLVHFVRQWPQPWAHLRGHDFTNVDMSECHAAGIDMSGSDFTRTVMRSGNFRGCVFKDCVMAGTILDAANMHGANLSGSMLVAAPQQGTRARHVLRPQMDEFLPWDRVLARSTDFEDACLDQCLITQADFTAATFENASLQDCLVEKCNMEGAVFTGSTWDRSHVYRSDLVSATLCDAQAQDAVFRSNEYVEVPVPRTIADSAWAFPRQCWGYIQEEMAHYQKLVPEIRTDYQRQLLFRFLVVASVPLLAILAWKYVETNAVLGLITAAGAVSTFALRRYFTMLLQSVFGFAFGKANDAEGLWRSGLRGKALCKAILSGMVTHKLMALRKK